MSVFCLPGQKNQKIFYLLTEMNNVNPRLCFQNTYLHSDPEITADADAVW